MMCKSLLKFFQKFGVGFILFSLWTMVGVWQFYSHQSVISSAESGLLTRVRDISSTLGVVIASDRKMGAVDPKHLERALNALTRSDELVSIGILNPENKVVAASRELKLPEAELEPGAVNWDMDNQVLRAVDLIVLGRGKHGEHKNEGVLLMEESLKRTIHKKVEGLQDVFKELRRKGIMLRGRGEHWKEGEHEESHGPFAFGPPEGGRRERPSLSKFMSTEEFENFYRRFGLHKFVVEMNTSSVNEGLSRDLYFRIAITILFGLTLAGTSLFWRLKKRSFGLELDLIKAEEQNNHLKELNLAAAGLAHETRNPLNVVRSKAQLMSRSYQQDDVLSNQCNVIVDEVDRITARLNEFISYSRPGEAEKEEVDCRELIGQVIYSLESDIEDKNLSINVNFETLKCIADKALFRQILFNLLYNCCSYVPKGGCVDVEWQEHGSTGCLIVRDDGPGIPTGMTTDIFRPYFTCHDEGTGLGLAVVRKLCMQSGWNISSEDTGGKGATFVISGIKQA